jgi:hypothetical protein
MSAAKETNMERLASKDPKVNADSVPWCWADKRVLRQIRNSFDSQNVAASALAVYHALTESASNHEREEFTDSICTIANLAGMSVRTAGDRLRDLARIGVIKMSTPKMKAPSTYTLVTFGNGCATIGNGCRTFGKREASPLPPLEEQKNRIYVPSLGEVKDFCLKSGISESDAEWFFHKCEGNGWTNGGKPIKRWTSTLLSWKTAGYLPSQKQKNEINRRNNKPNPRNTGIATDPAEQGRKLAEAAARRNQKSV